MIPALNNSKKYFGKSLERSKQKTLERNSSSALVEGTRKKIDSYDGMNKIVLPEELIRGKMPKHTASLKQSSKGKRSGYLKSSLRDTMSTMNLNKTFSSTLTRSVPKKSTKLGEEELRQVGVMNSILQESNSVYFNKRNVDRILKDRNEAIQKVSKGELCKELAMLACHKIWTRILEKREKIPNFEFKILIKDFIIQRNGRLNCYKFEGERGQSPEKDKLLSDIGLEKLKFPEVQEIANSLKAGLSRDEVLSLCLDVANIKKDEEHIEVDPERTEDDHHVLVEDFDT